MINQIIAFSIKNKLVIGLLTVAMVGLGIWSMTQVPVDAVPDITNNQVQVITQAPNLGTQDIEQFVTYPVEVALANLPGVQEIRSISRFGLSLVTIVFDESMGTYLPRQLVAEKLDQVRDEIPQGFGEPSMGPITTGLGEILQYSLQVDSAYRSQYSTTELRTIQDWIIRRQMAMVPGVIEVNGYGGNIKQYEVAINPDELKAIGLTINDIFQALEANNQNTGGAYIEKGHRANFIRGEGIARSLEDIEHIVVTTQNGIPIRIKDVATVQFGEAVRYGAFTKDGQGEAVGGMIFMLKGANSNEVITAVKERMEQIEKSLPEGVHIEPFLDRSELISRTTKTVKRNLIEGGLIVIFILVILLGNWRGGLIVASTIPLSLLFAFILMNVFDVWANLMSLGAIDFGIIVDGAVIIVESTVFYLHRHLRQNKPITAGVRDQVTYTSSSRMMNSAFFGQLIILIVFIPILFLEGVEGKMFKPMALTFSFAMIGAMVLCLTYVPMLSSLFIRVPKRNFFSWGDKIIRWVEDRYEPLLKGALKRAWLVIGSAVVLFALALFTFTRMGGEFIPQLDEGDIAFHIILKPGSALSESIKASTHIETLLLNKFPDEIDHAMTRFGVADVPTDPMPMDIGDCFLILAPKDQWTQAETKDEFIAKVKDTLNTLPGLSYEFTQPIEMRFNELITGVREDIAIKLYGEDLQVLADKAEEIGQLVSGIEGVADMNVEATTGLPQMTVKYQRDKLAQYGLQIRELNRVVQTAFAGGQAGVIFEGEKRFDLVVRLDSAYRTNIEDVMGLYVNLPNGSQIPLKEVAEISYQPGPMQISRENTNRRTYVGINVRGRDIKSLVQEIQQTLDAQLDLPSGYFIRYGGAFENLERATKRLQLVVPIALGLIFILIFFALGSFKQSLMIYMAIPLAAIGGVFSLWLRGMPFSISAGIGFIVLFGVAVLNGLVMINGLNELKEEGMHNLKDRIRQGTRRRIRPILLTALTDIFGFLPMAISISAGAEVQRPLATVVIGGLITSTLLTLFVLPILYQWTEQRIRLKPSGNGKGVLLIGFLLLSGGLLHAQSPTPISLEQAIEKAKTDYPNIQAARLEINNQRALRKTAWELGSTQVFTSGEELGNNNTGVYTVIGIQQQNMDLLGTGARKKLQDRKVALAEAALNLSEASLAREVKMSYGKLYSAQRRLALYETLDSLFQTFERAARIRYETEETSKLEYLSAANHARQMTVQLNEAQHDYQIALQRLNLWLVSDTVFTTQKAESLPWLDLTDPAVDPPGNHPLLSLEQSQVAVAEQQTKAAKTELLPKLNAQYGLQQIGGESGFYQYQVGISIPLLFMSSQGRIQSAKIESQIAEQELRHQEYMLESGYQVTRLTYQKWKESWEYYRDEALPLAEQERLAAALAYREGGLTYMELVQHLESALQIEKNALEALERYMQSQFELKFYTTPNK